MAEVMLGGCNVVGLCNMSPSTLHHNFSYYCTCIGVNDKAMNRAWSNAVFTVTPAKVDNRLGSIAAQLGATVDEAKLWCAKHLK